MENFDKKTMMLDDLIKVNEDKLNTLSGDVNRISSEISYVILEQMVYIKHILSNKKYKDGLNLTFMKKLFSFFKEFSFISFICLFIIFLFNFNILFAILTLLMAYISYFCKDKYTEYAGMISIYEAAVKEYYLDECKVDLSLIKIKEIEVQRKIDELKNKRDLIQDEIEVVNKIINRVIEEKKQLLSNDHAKMDSIEINKSSIQNEKKGNVLIKSLGLR